IGGVIAYSLGWRWAFHINIPICALLAIATAVFVEESSDTAARRLDPAGIASFAASMFGLTWGLINGQAHGWTSLTAVSGFLCGAIALGVFVIAERAQERPMLDLQLFRNPRFVGAVWAMFAYAASAQVMASMLPLFLQNGLGRSALESGFAMLPFAIAMLAFPHVGRRLARRLSATGILTFGLIVVGLGNALTGLGAYLGVWQFVMVGMWILGSGGGLLNGETQKAIMSVVPRERAGMASGISTTARFSGILLGFATLNGVLATSVRRLLAECGAPCQHTASFADAIVAGDLPAVVSGLTGPTRDIAIGHARLVFSFGFSTALMIAAAFALLSSIAIYRLMTAPMSQAL
ncbi:MAG TPA: MFS transporter, partial [Steroidobacteraceae bacterium]